MRYEIQNAHTQNGIEYDFKLKRALIFEIERCCQDNSGGELFFTSFHSVENVVNKKK